MIRIRLRNMVLRIKIRKTDFPVARHPGSRHVVGLAPCLLFLLQYGRPTPFSTNLGGSTGQCWNRRHVFSRMGNHIY
ncbi:hypothetical protein P691DRAFT_341987 [Macrolepiota fuliginosa MF-IS2]|uniref:Uncharacterized protein n=1 Tax=Macrolepiota fuliginosa MF-IS2 TaxID=1400762 RepID=A0A9P6C0C6_9AGAR|nr:hypothetical protein P691DRAFT_341987 [Macrolepiota fuliginosa MF-IS2]